MLCYRLSLYIRRVLNNIEMWERINVQSADVRFAALQLISAARNELGLIRDQSAQTTTRPDIA